MQTETTPTTPATEPALEIHPLADLLPVMDEKDYVILKHDIEAVGLQDPIVLYEAKILDGRHRYRACRELGIRPVYRDFAGNRDQALNYVISANMHRRHLNAGQRAAVALHLMKVIREEVHKGRRLRVSRARKARRATPEAAAWRRPRCPARRVQAGRRHEQEVRHSVGRSRRPPRPHDIPETAVPPPSLRRQMNAALRVAPEAVPVPIPRP